MTFESVLFLGIVLVSLIVFTVALAYGQWVTRNLNQAGTSAAAKPVKASRQPAMAHPRNAAHV